MRCNVLQENSSDPFFFSFLNPRTERLLAAPIVPTLARLSAPAADSRASVGSFVERSRSGKTASDRKSVV